MKKKKKKQHSSHVRNNIPDLIEWNFISDASDPWRYVFSAFFSQQKWVVRKQKMCAVKSQMPQVIENLTTEHVNRKWGFWNRKCFLQPEVGFCIIGQWFYPNVRQIFFIRERTLSSTILVAFRHVKGEKVSLQVDGRRWKTSLLKFPNVIHICKSFWISPNSVLVTGVLLKGSHMVLIFVTWRTSGSADNISEFTQQNSREKRTAKRLCVTNVTELLLAC